MSPGTLWSALQTAPRLAEGLVAAGDALAAGHSPLAAVDTFAVRSGVGTEVAAELRAGTVRAVALLLLVTTGAAEFVRQAPRVETALQAAVTGILDFGLWAAAQEYRLRGWLAEGTALPTEQEAKG